ncbi:hypothetical protein V8B55DRAFT_1028090 [Mucor lusitanicus]
MMLIDKCSCSRCVIGLFSIYFQMKLIIAFFVLCLFAIVQSLPLISDDGGNEDSVDKLDSLVCEPNSEFLQDCNLCLCSPDGTTTACSTLTCS